jgi:hypothetical protein
MGKIADLGKQFRTYVRANPLPHMIAAAVLALCYAKQAYSLNYYIDAETILNNPGSYYNWLEVDRFGLVLMKKVLGLSWYNPYLEAGLFLLTLWAAAVCLGFWFYLIDDRMRGSAVCLFPLLALVHPVYAQQFMFRFQAFEITAAILLLLLAEVFLVQFIREKNIPAFVLAVLCAVISFGVYQSMVNLALTLCMGGFLALTYQSGEDKKTVKRSIACYAAHFLLSFVLYEILVQIFCSSGDYLNERVEWFGGFAATLRHVLGYVYRVVTGVGEAYTASYAICLVLLLALVVSLIARRRKGAVWYLLGGLGLAASPFYLCVITGTETVSRAQLMLPFTCALILMFLLQCLCGTEGVKFRSRAAALCALAAFLCLYLDTVPLMRLFYTEDVVRRADEITAVRIIDELEDFASVHAGKSVVFIGHLEGQRNASSYSDDADMYVCGSVFGFDYGAEPKYFYSSHRILGYFQTLGFSYTKLSQEVMPEAYECARDMTCWPSEGSIQEFEHFVIVKLSEE